MKKYLMFCGIGLLSTLLVLGFSFASAKQPNQPEWKPLEQAPSELIQQFEQDNTSNAGTIKWKGSKFRLIQARQSTLYLISTLPLRTQPDQEVCGVRGCTFAAYISQGNGFRKVTSGIVRGNPEVLPESKNGLPCLRFERKATWCYDGKQYAAERQ